MELWLWGLISYGEPYPSVGSPALFQRWSAREPGDETVPEPNPDEVVVFEEFFAAGLQMPPHPVFTEILLKY
jgi:hypothetical protein